MNIKYFPPLLAAAAFFLLAAGNASTATPARPNVLFIVIDDLNTDVGFLGDTHAGTPCMDKLAGKSVVFENAHCQAPICGPSRNSFLTGKYPHHTGLYGLEPMFREVDDLKGITTLPQYFRENGYTSTGIGKIFHTKPDGKSFDKTFGWFGAFGPFPPQPIHPDKDLHVHTYYDWGPYLEDPETADYKVAETAVQCLKEAASSEKPFFLSVGFFRPHCPLYAPQHWFDIHPLDSIAPAKDGTEDMADISPYAMKLVSYGAIRKFSQWLLQDNRSAGFLQAHRACVSLTDHCVGMVWDALVQAGLEKNTIVVLLSDQGVQNGKKNLWFKRTLWEATTRVPLLIRTPQQDREQKIRTPVGLIDLYPTLCELAGLPVPAGLDGLSLLPLMQGRADATNRPPALTTYGPGNSSLRDDRWRYIHYADGSEELYDHSTDPEERNNLASSPESASVIKRLKPFLPNEYKDFAPGTAGLGSGAFPDK